MCIDFRERGVGGERERNIDGLPLAQVPTGHHTDDLLVYRADAPTTCAPAQVCTFISLALSTGT